QRESRHRRQSGSDLPGADLEDPPMTRHGVNSTHDTVMKGSIAMRRHIGLVRLAVGGCVLALLGVAACTKAQPVPGATGTSGTVISVRVTDVSLGRTLQSDNSVGDRTDAFKPHDTIYGSIKTEGSALDTNVTAR